jgi:hypothetical protein
MSLSHVDRVARGVYYAGNLSDSEFQLLTTDANFAREVKT